ncbi:MAG: hypothetical protein V1746_00500 [bacterium]
MNKGLMNGLLKSVKSAGENVASFRPSTSNTHFSARHTGLKMGTAGDERLQQPARPQPDQQQPMQMVMNHPAPVVAPQPAPSPASVQPQASQEQEKPALSVVQGGKGKSSRAPEGFPSLNAYDGVVQAADKREELAKQAQVGQPPMAMAA